MKNSSVLAGLALLISACASRQPRIDWGKFQQPYGNTPVSVGSYAAGCLEGAKALPLHAEEYRIMHQKRHRYYGNPELIAFLKSFTKELDQKKYGVTLIGDLSQPRGGPGTNAPSCQ